MSGELDFDANEFQKMSHGQKIRLCRLLAERARNMGLLTPAEKRGPYIRIAYEWDQLADEMEKNAPPIG